MIFLIEYDRARGTLVSFKTFNESDRLQAEELRLQLELSLKRKQMKHEVVLLEAITEEALRQTHRRYFENIEDLAKPREQMGQQ